VLKNKLATWGVDVTHWYYSQFKIDDVLFVLHEDHGRYNLVAKQKCKICKAMRHSFHIGDLYALGRVLANDNFWDYHECRPKEQPVAPRQPTREQQAYNLIKKLVGLVTNGQKQE